MVDQKIDNDKYESAIEAETHRVSGAISWFMFGGAIGVVVGVMIGVFVTGVFF
tara:strand:- start:79 stop:237 length:159 start_codon:yes stop_codon:yes gene_type:complete